jgi:hypothetical protein
MNSGDSFDGKDHLDDLGGAYLFADEEETFEARTPDVASGGCLSLIMIGFAFSRFITQIIDIVKITHQ